MKGYRLITLFVGLVLLGSGCQWFGSTPDSSARNAFSGLSPVEAAEKLQFLPGDSFDIAQQAYGLETLVPNFLKSDKGVRKVTVTRFAPMNGANVDWETTLDVETDASKSAQDAYMKALDELSQDAEIPVRPEPEYETRSVSGTLAYVNLKTSHKGFFPAYWREGKQSASDEFSGVWLSDDAFQELSRTGQTAFSFNVFQNTSAEALRGLNALQDAVAALKQESQTAKKEHTDIDLLKTTEEAFDYELTIDGQPVTVEAIKARNWFGEMTVLKNRQNPIILEVSINPLAAGVNEAIGDKVGSLQGLFGYKITDFNLKQY